jgi:hypothetical protein
LFQPVWAAYGLRSEELLPAGYSLPLSPTAKKEKKVGILYLSIVLLLITTVVISARLIGFPLDFHGIPSQIYPVAHVEFTILVVLDKITKWAVVSIEGL